MGNTTYAIRKGWISDPECHRTTYRREAAMRVLSALGAAPTAREHAEDCERHPKRIALVCFGYKNRVVCGCGRDRDPFDWPAWVTDEMIEAAYRAADLAQTGRGDFNRAAADRAKRDRERN